MKIIVATDLDGTLLNHHNYRFDAALPALARLRAAGIPLVLATSKTACEVEQIHTQLQLGSTPAIVENGAGIHFPCSDVGNEPGSSSPDRDYERIRTALTGLPAQLCALFRGFGDMSTGEIQSLTGLDAESVVRAKMRHHSEPGIWLGSDQQLAEFTQQLLQLGIHARRGGRFLTLSFGQTKADALHMVKTFLNAEYTIALGDAPNDIEMLEAADQAVIVRNDSGAPLPVLEGERVGRIQRSIREGPAGWNDAILDLLDSPSTI